MEMKTRDITSSANPDKPRDAVL